MRDFLLEITPPKDVLFIIGEWNAKVEIQVLPGATGKFGLGVQNEAGQKTAPTHDKAEPDYNQLSEVLDPSGGAAFRSLPCGKKFSKEIPSC